MKTTIDYKGNKGFRLLSIYESLKNGEVIHKEELANRFNVSAKTIQRDIDDLRAYLAETYYYDSECDIKYSKSKNGYYLVKSDSEWLTSEEVLALCKIILESRAFCKDELSTMLEKLLLQTTPADRKKVRNIINNEYFYYIPLKHNKPLLKVLWELSEYINNQEMITYSYIRQDGAKSQKIAKPVSIMFSEYYFYLIVFEDGKDYPIIYRVDRISNISAVGKHFDIPYKDRFSDTEFRKRVQFMYSGELKRVCFEYSGVLEALLDRLPTAKILKSENGKYTVTAEAYGDGIFMWLRTQGDKVKILSQN
ncbi:MAG: helix-turn-helix transcriptional regulator [Acutalibacteraceae bacterium]